MSYKLKVEPDQTLAQEMVAAGLSKSVLLALAALPTIPLAL